MTKKKAALLEELYQCITDLPFGQHVALPWCRESFPRLHELMLQLEQLEKTKDD